MKLPIKNIINYYRRARTIYKIHSPSLYDFATNVYDTSRRYYAFDRIEAFRYQLLHSKEVMTFKDFGTGKDGKSNYEVPVKEVARQSLSRKNQCRILFNMVNYYKPGKVLELGTSLGIATSYLASPSINTEVYTIEGNPASLRLAQRVWKRLGIRNITAVEGVFEEVLKDTLEEMGQVDFCFIDGHHRYEPTMDYYGTISPHLHHQSIVVIDDIYWSHEMHQAWQELSSRPEVKLAIDMFHSGVLFFNPAVKEKQVVSLIPFKYKPFSLGIFG